MSYEACSAVSKMIDKLTMPDEPSNLTTIGRAQLAQNLKIGDLIFIHVSAMPFHAVAVATGVWTNHVGVVTHTDNDDPRIGESAFPLSRTTTLSHFLARSNEGKVAICRLHSPLTPEQIQKVQEAAHRRAGILYDTGFNLRSKRQFCSRYVHEVINEATGVSIGKIETFRQMLASQPIINLSFWRLWYLGLIPWDQETITPASVLKSPELHPVFHGKVITSSK